MTPAEEAAHRFLDAVEAVFHSDWEFTRYSLSAGEETDSEGVTFLSPKMSPDELERQNWGNYETFLERYQALCAALGRKPIV
jgi:hypothetical protein